MHVTSHHNLFDTVDKNSTSLLPRLYSIVRYLLVGTLAVSGAAKLIDATGLLTTLQQIPFLNEELSIWIATLLPILEIGLAVALFAEWKPRLTLPTTFLLFTGFLGFSIYGLYMHMAGDCGCFGNLVESNFGWGMVARDFTFFCMAGILWLFK